ncbi:MAG: PAAR domain-containing protein [Pseudomonadales bacterium]
MGQPAARLNDPTTHGKPLSPGPGASTVLIGGLPAWRVGIDFHVCPLVTGVVPHVGGMVAIGSTTVFIEKMPAARQGDQLIEVGPPDPIAMGEPTVLIG